MSLEDLKAYVAFVMVHSRAQWLGEDFAQVRFKFFEANILGQQQRLSRNSFCLNRIIEYFPHLIGKYYYMKAFDYERKRNAFNMINLIKDVMKEHISQSSWLDKNTENAAKTKLSKVIPLIGQPTEPRSYPLGLSPDDYPTNVHTILSHLNDVELEKIGQRVNRKEWEISAVTVNALYTPSLNVVVFPAGILQPPYFNGAKFHPARNFGGVGTAMGHELTHGFDTFGRNFDGDGNQRVWWSESTSAVYENLTNHIVEQYSSFQVKGEDGVMIGTVNGALTINENIADNGGVALAWDAYRKYMKNIQQEIEDGTGDQLFFLSFAQTLCKKTRDEKMKKQLSIDAHSPSQWRVNGVVMNNKDFAKVFKCKANARMNPVKKWKIWY